MQTILNQKDRTDAFFKFLFFFLLTVALVVAAVYINFRLPVRQNRMLQSRVTIFETQERNQKLFVQQADEVQLLLDSLQNDPVDYEQVELALNQKLSELSMLQQKDVNSVGDLNKKIVENFSVIKQQLKDQKESESKYKKLEEDNKDLEKRLNAANETVAIQSAQLGQ
jgi:hypothetical protein